MLYYPLAKKCKLDFPWLGPYLVVSLCGWAVGIQLQPDSAVLFVHCQDLKKIPQPRCLVSWLPEPDQPELGASTVDASCSTASSLTGLPSVPSLPRPPTDPDSGLPVLSLLPPPPPPPGHVLHPFSVTCFDARPVRLRSIAHAFTEYRVYSTL